MKSRCLLLLACLSGILFSAVEVDAMPAAPPRAAVEVEILTGDEGLARAWEQRLSGIFVRCQGRVVFKLPDDLEGSRHQRFLIRLSSGQTVLIVHNIDLVKRVAGLKVGDRVRVRGEYIWNEKGGLIHKTHRDPGGEDPSRWIKHRGVVYR